MSRNWILQLYRVGWGKRKAGHLKYLYAKTWEPMINIFISHWNRESKTDDPVIISSLTFNSETKISSDSLCPTILNLPHPTLAIGTL